MRDSLVAKRYARALHNLVGNQNIEKTCEQLQAIAGLFDTPSIAKILRSPVVSPQLKIDVLKEACRQVNADEQTTAFTKSIVAACRVASIPSIAFAFQEIADEQQNIVRTKLSSAVALDEGTVKEITAILQKKLGKRINAVTEVDPDIMGGLVVEIGHNKIDLSLKSKLEHLAQSVLS